MAILALFFKNSRRFITRFFDYIHELNIGNALTSENVERLLLWKLPKVGE